MRFPVPWENYVHGRRHGKIESARVIGIGKKVLRLARGGRIVAPDRAEQKRETENQKNRCEFFHCFPLFSIYILKAPLVSPLINCLEASANTTIKGTAEMIYAANGAP